MVTSKTASSPTGEKSLAWLVWGAWILVGILALGIARTVGEVIGPLDFETAGMRALFNGFGRAMVISLPTILIIGALTDVADFFRRCEGGERFTDRNVRTVSSAAGGLIWAAFASAVITPTVLGWIDGSFRGFVWQVNDLALGVGAMGCALWGVATVWRDGVRLQDENDEIV